MVRNNVYSLAKFLWSIDLRPIADKLTKDYLVIYGSRDAMACHAGLASSSLYNLTKNRVLPISVLLAKLTAQYSTIFVLYCPK